MPDRLVLPFCTRIRQRQSFNVENGKLDLSFNFHSFMDLIGGFDANWLWLFCQKARSALNNNETISLDKDIVCSNL